MLIGGEDVTLRAANERDVSMVFQSYALFPHMTVLENVCYGPLSMRREQGRGARARAGEARRCSGSPGSRSACPPSCPAASSSASPWRASLVLEPAVLLFDEPLSNLDAKLRRRVREEIRELQQSLNLTVLYVTHDQEEALAVSDQVIVMDGGRIAQQGTPQELYEAPASRFLADFIGDANLVDGELEGRDDARDASRPAASACRCAPTASRRGPRRWPCGRTGCASSPPAPACWTACASACPTSAAASSTSSRTPWGELLVFDGDMRVAARPRRRGRRVLRPRTR